MIGPVSSKLILKHFGVMKIQVYSNEESHYFHRGYKSNKMKILRQFLEIFSKTTGSISVTGKLGTKHLFLNGI